MLRRGLRGRGASRSAAASARFSCAADILPAADREGGCRFEPGRPGPVVRHRHSRKTDARDAHSIAVVAVRTKTLSVCEFDGELEAMRMLCARREELTRLRVQTVNRLQRLLSELVPGQRKKDLTTLQAGGDSRHGPSP